MTKPRSQSPRSAARRATRPPVRGLDPQIRLLAAALRSMSEGVLITERRWTRGGMEIIFANDGFATMTGYPSDEIVGRNTLLLHGPKSNLAPLRKWHRTARPGVALNGEGFIYHKSGSAFYAAWSFNPVADAAGHITHVVAIYRDLTDVRRLQEALTHSQKLDAVGQLAGGIAHDFNNLVSVINGYCEMLGARFADGEPAKREIEEIHKAGLKAATLTRQLLAFSRRQEMDLKVINLNDVIHNVADILRHLAGPQNTIELRLAADLANVRADPAKIQQVILNLVMNARDALPDGGLVILRTGNRTVPPGKNRRSSDLQTGTYAVLSIIDNGIGMDEETQNHLFEPFFTTKDPDKGTGLGLSTAYGIVRQSSGYITVQSKPGRGSTFEIYLPVVHAPAQTYESQMPLLSETKGRETVLLVEGDGVVGKMIAGILSADGYHVQAAATPEEAQTAAATLAVELDLLIIDLSMPRQQGVNLALALRKRNPRLKVLSISSEEKIVRVPDMPPGTQAHLQKPFALSSLMKEVRALLDGLPPPGEKL